MAPVDAPLSLQAIVPAVLAAGRCALRWQRHGCAAEAKSDASPVTVADREAEAILLDALSRLAPDTAVVAEEEAAAGRVPVSVGHWFFLVDPLDGTREFVGGYSDFTVNVALIEGDAPRWGVVYAPARGLIWGGDVVERAAWRAMVEDYAIGAAQPIAVRRDARTGPPRVLTSRSHRDPATGAWMKACGATSVAGVGSSLKFALVASGEADVYPRTGTTMEWDTAAGDAILRAAGGRTLCADGRPLAYRKPGYRNGGFIATGAYDPQPLRPFLDAAASVA